jgi:hypothetical protein
MKIEVPSGRGTHVIWYEQSDGHKFVQFVDLWNYPKTVEIPDGSKILTLEDLLNEKTR